MGGLVTLAVDIVLFIYFIILLKEVTNHEKYQIVSSKLKLDLASDNSSLTLTKDNFDIGFYLYSWDEEINKLELDLYFSSSLKFLHSYYT